MRVLSRYTRVVKQSNSVSLETPTTEGGLSLANLSAKIIKHNHIILYTYLKQHDAPEDIEYYLCGPPMMSKTVLDLLHSLGVEDDMIMFDNFGG